MKNMLCAEHVFRLRLVVTNVSNRKRPAVVRMIGWWYLGTFRVKHLLGSEESLQISDEEKHARVVQRRQLVVQLGIQLLVRTLRLLQQLLPPGHLQLVPLLWIALQRLEVVSLTVVVYQFAAALVNFFLKNRPNWSVKRLSSSSMTKDSFWFVKIIVNNMI